MLKGQKKRPCSNEAVSQYRAFANERGEALLLCDKLIEFLQVVLGKGQLDGSDILTQMDNG